MDLHKLSRMHVWVVVGALREICLVKSQKFRCRSAKEGNFYVISDWCYSLQFISTFGRTAFNQSMNWEHTG